MSPQLTMQIDQLDSKGLLAVIMAAATRLEKLSSTVSQQQPPAPSASNSRQPPAAARPADKTAATRGQAAMVQLQEADARQLAAAKVRGFKGTSSWLGGQQGNLRYKFDEKKYSWLEVVPAVGAMVAGTGGSVVVTTFLVHILSMLLAHCVWLQCAFSSAMMRIGCTSVKSSALVMLGTSASSSSTTTRLNGSRISRRRGSATSQVREPTTRR